MKNTFTFSVILLILVCFSRNRTIVYERIAECEDNEFEIVEEMQY